MLFEPLDVAKLIGLSGCLLSMAVIVSVLVRGTLPPLWCRRYIFMSSSQGGKMYQTMSQPLPSIGTGLAHYLAQIRKFPVLTKEEETNFARRWRDQGDREAAYRLVTSHLRLVAKIAMRYRGYGLPIADIVSEGNVGLMQAVRRFDPERGTRLSTYAMWWIKATIQEYVLRSWSLVKISANSAQKKLFFKLRRAKRAISALEDGDLRPDQVKTIASRLDVPEREVVDMDRRLRGDLSLNLHTNNSAETGDALERLVDPSPTHDIQIARRRGIDPTAPSLESCHSGA
jgi:RNA polymerase sigma-32 factor